MSLASDPRDAIFSVEGMTQNLGAKTGRSATTILIFAAVRLGVTILSTAILARLVPPAEQGLIALAIPAVLIASGLSEFGLAHAVVQRPVVTHRLVTTLFWINVGLAVTLGTAVGALGGPAARFYDQPLVQPVFVALTPFILFTVLSGQFVAILRRRMRIFTVELCNVTGVIIGAGVAIGAAAAGAGHWALVIQLVLSQALTFLFLFLAARWVPSPPWHCDFREARSAINFGGFLAAERLVNEVMHNLQLVVIGRYFTEVQAALFYRSNTFAQMPQRRVVAPLSGAFIPSLSRLQDAPEEFRRMFRRQISRGNLILVPVGLLMVTCADLLVLVLLGPDWSAAAPIMALLGIAPLVALTLSCLTWTLIASGQSRALFVIQCIAAVAVITAMLLAVPYGLEALVAAYLFALVLVRGGLLMMASIRHTPVNASVLGGVVLEEALFIAIGLTALLTLRSQLALEPILLEGVAAAALVALLYSVRLAFNADLRGDVLKALRLKRGNRAA